MRDRRGGFEGRREDNMFHIRLCSDTISYQSRISPKQRSGYKTTHIEIGKEGFCWQIEACQMSLNGDIDYKSITVIYFCKSV